MKSRVFLFSVMAVAGLAMLVAFGSKVPTLSNPTSDVAYAKTVGHGGPNGPHYNLNIIGVPRDKTADMTGNQGHRIFVKLQGNSKIWLSEAPEGESYQVLDANGTDSDGAKFQLPDPDPDNDGITRYSVYARALGPGGEAFMTTCYVDAGDTVCSGEILTLARKKENGPPKFSNVSKELLTLCIDTDEDGTCDQRMFLFDNKAYKYFWDYDNNGLKLAQLRFYPLPDSIGLNP